MVRLFAAGFEDPAEKDGGEVQSRLRGGSNRTSLAMRLPLLAACVAAVTLGLDARVACAQGSRADYERAANFRRLTTNTVFRDRVEAHWLPGNTRFWYEVTTGPGTREYVLVDAEKGERKPAFDHERLAQALKAAGVEEARADKLALRELAWPSSDTLSFNTARKSWRVAAAKDNKLPDVLPDVQPPPRNQSQAECHFRTPRNAWSERRSLRNHRAPKLDA